MNKFEAFQDIGDKWRWRLIAANGRIIASSGESFASHINALRAAETVRATAPNSFVSTEPGVGLKALFARLIHKEERKRALAAASRLSVSANSQSIEPNAQRVVARRIGLARARRSA